MNCSSHQHPHDASTSSFHDILEISSMTMNNKKVNESKKKILDLTKQIEHAELINKTISTTTTSIQQQQQNQYDWTNTYQYWNKWEDIDELKLQKENEASRLNNFIEENNFMGHCNDHTEERKFFELPENEKLLYCERHRLLGNYLYSEGMLPKAAEQYQLV